MKIVFITNFINHHQVPLADEFYKILGEDYCFIATEKLPSDFAKRGYPDFSDRPYLIEAFGDYDKENVARLIIDADVVIIGSASDDFISERLKQNLLIFRYNERWFKSSHWISPRGLYFLYKKHLRYKKSNIYMLAASAYTANDVYTFGYKNKCFKWGYFPYVSSIDLQKILEKKRHKRVRILWCARFIDWKHPEFAVLLANQLKKKGYSFILDMIGDGELFSRIKRMIDELQLSDCIRLHGNYPNEKVRELMLQANIFLFTSDRNEGWGAVLNEAMSSGCAVVASNMIGSAPYLIQNGVNGYMYEDGNLNSAYSCVERLLLDQSQRELLSQKAYQSMSEVWSPQSAVYNFLLLANSLILGKECNSIDYGPCSIAVPINPQSVLL